MGEVQSTGSDLRTVIMNSKAKLARTTYESWHQKTPQAEAAETKIAELKAAYAELSKKIADAPQTLQTTFKAFEKKTAEVLDTEVASTEAAREAHAKKVTLQLTAAATLKSDIEAAATVAKNLIDDATQIKAFETLAKFLEQMDIGPGTQETKQAAGKIKDLRQWATQVTEKQKPLTEKQRASFQQPRLDDLKKIYTDAAAAHKALTELTTRRGQLTTLLDKAIPPRATPESLVPGATTADVQIAMDAREAISAKILAPDATLATLEDIGKEIDGLAALLQTAGKNVAEKQRLVTTLDALVGAKAKPGDIIPGATAADVKDIQTQRGTIAAKIAASTDAQKDAVALEADIGALKKLVAKTAKGIGALQAKRDEIGKAASALSATNPPGCTAEQAKALDGGREAIDKALKEPLTADNNTAAEALVAAQTKLLEEAATTVKAAKKNLDATTGPILKTLRTVKADFERLKIAAVWDFTAIDESVEKIKAATQAGKWTEAAALAQTLDKDLAEPKKIAKGMTTWRDTQKLLAGTYDAALVKLGKAFTLAEAEAALKALYKTQCDVSRDNWLTHLDVAGAVVKAGNDANHVTLFNDAILPGVASASVETRFEILCGELFETAAWHLQLHATYVVGQARYHKYWGGKYSKNVNDDKLESTNKRAFDALNARFDEMKQDMETKVRAAIAAHGRIGTNSKGPTVT
jgi:hypothetical protein